MKIITWNCQGAFRKKTHIIQELRPDILIVPECENPDKIEFNNGIQKPNDKIWFESSYNKGLAVFSFGDFKLNLLDIHNTDFKLIIPVAVTGGSFDFTLFAIWAYNRDDPDGQYIEQVWKAVHYYDKLLSDKQSVLIGDFNSNTIWDMKHKPKNHSNVVRILEEKGIYSTYHLFHKQVQGKEQHPTFYMNRNKDKPYHIDYCFVSDDMAEKLQSVEIGEHGHWGQHSDHMPLIATFNL